MTSEPKKDRRQIFQIRRATRACMKALFVVFLVYVIFLALGFVPVNRSYTIPPESDRVRIYVGLSDVHTDIIMPVTAHRTDGPWNWMDVFPASQFPKQDVSNAKFVSVGWGDRGFYFETPTWSDLTATNLANALLVPSQSVLHVEYRHYRSAPEYMRPVEISKTDFDRLVEFIMQTVGKTDEAGAAVPLTDFSYRKTDRFYYAKGSYHLFNTCNQWTGRALKKAGVPTGLWTPLVSHVTSWLPTNPEVAKD